jgi:hypothetical protein
VRASALYGVAARQANKCQLAANPRLCLVSRSLSVICAGCGQLAFKRRSDSSKGLPNVEQYLYAETDDASTDEIEQKY